MKKALAILGGIFLVFLVAAGLAVGYLATVGPKFDASSKAYVDQTIRKIALTWSSDALINQGCSDFRKSVNDKQVQALFSKLAALGKLTQYEGSRGDAHINIAPSGVIVTASYQAKATFEHGDATFNVSLLRVADEWRIYGFHVESPLLLR